MKKDSFLVKYMTDFKSLVSTDKKLIENLVKFSEILKNCQLQGKKAIIVGNGGSAAIASHFSVDLTKNAGVRCINFNESDLITCFANDYGFDNWIAKAVEFYGDPEDVFIGISSSGKSLDIINGCNAARSKNINKIITFSGFDERNPLNQQGDLNFWVDSKAYNFVENIHQIWLLAVVDLIIGKTEYLAN